MTTQIEPLIETILRTGQVTADDGATLPLGGHIDSIEGAFIARLIENLQPTSTLEIGCAYGISSLFICDTLRRLNPAARHTIIDPHESTLYRGIGVTNLRRAELNNFDLIEDRSQFVLPKLVDQERRFQFALIDGYHTFDGTLNDFYYIDMLTPVGAIVVFDDVQMPPINRCVRYVLEYPNYKVVGSVNPPTRPLWKRAVVRVADGMAAVLRTSLRGAGHRIFNEEFLRPDRHLGISGSMVALQKISTEARGWDWFRPF
jgi:predicted O-methyltransferase YrrM